MAGGFTPDMKAAPEPRPGNRLSTLWTVAVFVLILYLTPLLVVAVDEEILGTYWLSQHFPAEAQKLYFYAYPFMRFFYPG